MNEADLLRKLSAIEQLIRGATTGAEHLAALEAKKRMKARLEQLPKPDQDWHFSIPDLWARKLFTALAKKLGLEPFRYRGQRRTTLVVHSSAEKKDLLWTQFLRADETLRSYLDEVTDRVISQALGGATDEVPERVEQKALPFSG